MTDKWMPEIRVDPQFRCAVLNFYGDRLALLPFKQEGGLVNTDVDETTSKYPFLPSYVISVSSIDPKIRNVVDIAFLYDYFEPTLAILYETTQTWTGRLAARRDTKSLIVVSLDITQKNYPVLFQVDHLPYNCSKIVPVPSPVGGLLVFSPNAVIYVDQTSVPGLACAVNQYYGMEEHFPAPPTLESAGQTATVANPLYSRARVSDFKSMGLALEGCVSYFLNPDTLMLVLNTGEMVLLELVGDQDVGTGWKRRKSGVRRFGVMRLGLGAVKPTCGTRLGGIGEDNGKMARILGGLGGVGGVLEGQSGLVHYGYLFVGSRVTDSMLIQFSESENVWTVQTGDDKSQTAEKPVESAQISSLDDDMDDDIYGDTYDVNASPTVTTQESTTTSNKPATSSRYRFRVCDALLCTGPIRDAKVGAPTTYSTFQFQPPATRLDLEIVTCSGEGVHGALGILQRNVRPQIISSFEMQGVNEMWTVRCSSLAEKRRKSLSVAHALNDVNWDEGENGDVAADGAKAADQAFDKFLIMSKENGTMILETGEELQEVEETEFYREAPTVAVGTVLNETAIVQVHPNGILLLDNNGIKMQELPIGEQDRWVVSCNVLDPYVLLLMNIGEVMLFVVEEETRTLKMCQELKDLAISACCLYCDDRTGALFPTVEEATETLLSMESKSKSSSLLLSRLNPSKPFVAQLPKSRRKTTRKRKRSISDLDTDLYGTADDGLDGDIYASARVEEEEEEVEEEEDGVEVVEGGSVAMEDVRQDGEDVNGTKANGRDVADDANSAPMDVTEETVSHIGADGKRVIPEKRFWCLVYREDGALEAGVGMILVKCHPFDRRMSSRKDQHPSAFINHRFSEYRRLNKSTISRILTFSRAWFTITIHTRKAAPHPRKRPP
ncbi:Cleavage and polyadenylation specificity factor subunit 1 [Borealophlyctis nickersoniae]|nr:Cleavage and polyadenylation specificity factor subunit 1 [Borealophlyctis nickersoniae]